jgi:hypothetical protein
MKIVHTEFLIRTGAFSESSDWATRYAEICEAIKAVEWPLGSGSFTLYDQPGKRRGKGSGVKPIKDLCMSHLVKCGWTCEVTLDIAAVNRPGKIDAACTVSGGLLCVEWETGNISSSHRALNKMCLGMLKGVLVGGVLILPTRCMYKYLTDRVGNYKEIEPYFPLWQSLPIRNGVLCVIAVEHDNVSQNVPRIPKGTDGRSLQ